MESDEQNTVLSEERLDSATHQLIEELRAQNTQLRQRQQLLEAERDKYARLYRSAPVSFFLVSENGQILVANRLGAQLLSIESTFLLGKPLARFIFEGDKPHFYQYCQQTLAKQHEHVCEIRMVRANGAMFYAQLDSVVVENDKGYRQLQIVVNDITTRKQAEQALQMERRLFFNGPTVVFKWKNAPGWPVEYVSPNIENQFGYSPNEFLDKRFRYADVIHTDDLTRITNEVVTCSQTGIQHYVQEYRLRCKDGRYRWVYDFTMLVYDLRGILTHYLGYVLDITVYKQVEQALRKSEARLAEAQRAILNASTDPILLIEKDGTCVTANPATARRFGVSIEQMIGHRIYEFMPEDIGSSRATFVEKVVQTGHPVFFQDESAGIHFEHCLFPAFDENGAVSYVAIFSDDITERRRADEALKKANERFTTVLDSLESAVCVADMQTHELLFTNQYVQKMANSENLGGERCWEILREGQKGPCEFCTNDKIMNVAGQPTGVYTWEFQSETNERWFFVQDRAIRWVDGRWVRLEIATDITDRKRMEETLKQERDFISAVLDTVGALIVVLDPAGRIIRFNKTCEQLSGYTFNEVKGKYIWTFLNKEEEATALQEIFRYLQSGQVIKNYENHWLTRNDQQRLISWSDTVIYNETGTVEYIIGTGIDVTERRQMEEALRKERDFVNAIVNMAGSFVVVFDRYGTIVRFNRSCERLTGYNFNEVAGKRIWELFLSAESANKVQRTFNNLHKLPSRYETEWISRHQTRHVIDWSNATLLDASGEIEYIIAVGVDITVHKRVEEALRHSESRLAEAQQIAHVGHWEWNLITGEEQWSEEILSILGLPPSTLVTHEIFESTIHPDDREQVLHAFEDAAYHNQPYRVEFRVVRSDNTQRYVKALGKLMRDANGKPLRFLGTAQDITEHKLAEEALRESEEYRRTLIEESLMGLGVFYLDGTIREVNPAFANILGYAPEEMLNQLNYRDITPAKYAKFDEKQLAIFRITGRLGPYEKEFLHRNGYPVPVKLSGLLIKHKGQNLIWASIEDISEQKRVEANTRDLMFKLNQFKTTLDMTLDCVFMFDPKTFKFFYVNQGAMNQVGYSHEELLNMTPVDIKMETSLERLQRLVTPLIEGIQPALKFESIHQHKNTTLIPLEVFLQYIQIPAEWENPQKGDFRFVAIVRDITERKQAEAKLQQAKDAAEQARLAAETANRAKSIFLANMSHELRTPLNVILGYAQIFNRDNTLDEQEREWMDAIHRSGEYLLTLINDILDLSKIEAEHIELCATDFNFENFLKGIIELFQMRAKQKNIVFNYQIPSASVLPTIIRADEKRLRQILMNLLSNAIKFTEQGSVIFKVNCQNDRLAEVGIFPLAGANKAKMKNVRTRQKNLKLKIEHLKSETYRKIQFLVEDTGIGIAPEELPKIFLPFQQAGTQVYRSEGTGLGLSISKKLVEMMGGELHVESTLGKGSKFWMTLDLLEVRTVAPSALVAETVIVGFTGVPRKILVVEDKRENWSVLVDLLMPLGFELAEATNGQEGIEKAFSWRPDLILMDLVMPVMDGFQATRHIRQIPLLQDVIIIAISASAFDYHQQQSLEAGCNDFIAKPFRADELLEKLHKHLNLTWTYQTKPYTAENYRSSLANEQSTTAKGHWSIVNGVGPSPEQATILFDLATRGDINGIVKYMEYLAEMDTTLIDFTKNILQLARQFQKKQIHEIARYYTNQTATKLPNW
ncbi:MAG: hypothetical protein BWK79_09950 [Beggiatoa sp. IS2]|nr:MAG: hypothetical protein BWK79_09950 [Beggiatoa sp. IS2]